MSLLSGIGKKRLNGKKELTKKKEILNLREPDTIYIPLIMGASLDFDVHVKEGDRVTANTLVATMKLDEVMAAGKKTDIITVITNSDVLADFTLDKKGESLAKEAIGEATKN